MHTHTTIYGVDNSLTRHGHFNHVVLELGNLYYHVSCSSCQNIFMYSWNRYSSFWLNIYDQVCMNRSFSQKQKPIIFCIIVAGHNWDITLYTQCIFLKIMLSIAKAIPDLSLRQILACWTKFNTQQNLFWKTKKFFYAYFLEISFKFTT